MKRLDLSPKVKNIFWPSQESGGRFQNEGSLLKAILRFLRAKALDAAGIKPPNGKSRSRAARPAERRSRLSIASSGRHNFGQWCRLEAIETIPNSARNIVPIDDVDGRRQVIRSPVLILAIIGVLPNIDAAQGLPFRKQCAVLGST